MDKVAVLLNEMVEQGIIADYAVFGAVAQMRYTEAVVTLDADILVAVTEPDKLDVLGSQQKIIPHLACLLARLLRYIQRHVSRYAPLNVPCRRTQIRRNLVDLFLTVILKPDLCFLPRTWLLARGRSGQCWGLARAIHPCIQQAHPRSHS